VLVPNVIRRLGCLVGYMYATHINTLILVGNKFVSRVLRLLNLVSHVQYTADQHYRCISRAAQLWST
jgi:hypothetical protein